MFSSTLLCLLAGLPQNYSTNFHKIQCKGGTEETTRVLVIIRIQQFFNVIFSTLGPDGLVLFNEFNLHAQQLAFTCFTLQVITHMQVRVLCSFSQCFSSSYYYCHITDELSYYLGLFIDQLIVKFLSFYSAESCYL